MSINQWIDFLKWYIHTESESISQLPSRVWLLATLWTVAHQPALFMEFSRQEYWSGLPFLSPGDFPDQGINPRASCTAGRFFLPPEPP